MVRNKEMFYTEVRKNAIQMKEEGDGSDANIELKKAALLLTELFSTVNKEGLFALEEAAAGIEASEIREGMELKRMITMVVNGTDPEMLEDICLKSYYSRDYSGLNGYLYLIYLDAILEIQAGVSPMIFEENLKSYMPPEVIEEMDKQREERKRKGS